MNVSTQIAFKLFKRKKYDLAAKFLLMSGLRFETVVLMYLRGERTQTQATKNGADQVKVFDLSGDKKDGKNKTVVTS